MVRCPRPGRREDAGPGGERGHADIRPCNRIRVLGKIVGLLGLLRTKGDLIEADLRRFHRIDLRDLWRPGGGSSQLTLRLLYVLIRHGLPIDSALVLDDNNGRVPWTNGDHLLADLWEQKANVGRGRKPKIRHPRRLEMQKRQTARKSDAKRAKFERAKARREKQLGTTE